MSVENGNEQETDVLLSQPSATESDKLESSLTAEMHAGPIENATNNMGLLLEPLEKRRSARVRPDVDLTDGLNRYRSRRGYGYINENRAGIKSPGRVSRTAEAKPKPLNRFRCAERLRALLPAIMR
ncbi:hypothetical protein FBUS_08191 [Fasciolopsis buskii]|uniref:Uncharacterized protein n=1 Tax=Fasciolopsis buskii TaxID=27845 RepID=A0A8E0S4R9_9TREM|nr:hypothetical protein FBUS_08191 [Fasciolopsis buski]